MRSTLFYIPEQIGPVPFLRPEGFAYGVGLLLAVVLFCGGIMLYSKYRRQGTSGDFLGSVSALVVLCIVVVFVLPYIIEKGRGLPIRGYGAMLLVSVVGGVALAMWRARQVGANPEIILSMMFLIFIGGLVGARGLYVIEYWKDFAPDFESAATKSEALLHSLGRIVNMTTGGLVVYGSLLGAGVAFGIYVWRRGLPPLALCDIVVASLLLGQGLGRVGCLLNGCCYGAVCELPNVPKITFPFGSPAHHRQVEDGQVYLHGLKLASDEAAEAEVEQHIKTAKRLRKLKKDELPANLKPSALIASVQPGSAAESAGLRPGQSVVGIYPADVEAGGSIVAEKIIPNPTRDEVHRELFKINGESSRQQVTLVVADDGGRERKTWTVAPTDLWGTLPVHPTQIYSAINALVMCLFAWCYFPFRRRDGEVFGVMLIIFPIARFMMEWIRTDEPAFIFANTHFAMTISQLISLGLLASAIPFWYWVCRQPSGGKLTPTDWQMYNARWADGAATA